MKIEAFTILISQLIAAADGGDYTYWIGTDIDADGDGTVTISASYSVEICCTDECWTALTGPGITLSGYCDSGMVGDDTGIVDQWVTWRVAGGEICADAAALIDAAREIPGVKSNSTIIA